LITRGKIPQKTLQKYKKIIGLSPSLYNERSLICDLIYKQDAQVDNKIPYFKFISSWFVVLGFFQKPIALE
jgi:hypothetical protein